MSHFDNSEVKENINQRLMCYQEGYGRSKDYMVRKLYALKSEICNNELSMECQIKCLQQCACYKINELLDRPI